MRAARTAPAPMPPPAATGPMTLLNEGAMPSQLLTLVVADRFQLDSRLLARAIVINTALAFATISFTLSFAAWGLVGGLASVFAELYGLTASQTALLVAVPVLLYDQFQRADEASLHDLLARGDAPAQQAHWPRMMLHACEVSLPHPLGGDRGLVRVSSPAPFTFTR